jgi:hypothetical protein
VGFLVEKYWERVKKLDKAENWMLLGGGDEKGKRSPQGSEGTSLGTHGRVFRLFA